MPPPSSMLSESLFSTRWLYGDLVSPPGSGLPVLLLALAWAWVLGRTFWVVAGLSGVYTKAGYGGWLALVPGVHLVVLGMIAGWDWLWIIALFVPYLNVVFWILLMVDLGRVYGRGVAFTLGLIVLPMLFVPLLGVDGSEYLGPRTIVVAS